MPDLVVCQTGACALLGAPHSLIGPPADIYSLGLVLHEAAAGSRPYASDAALRLFLAAANHLPAPPAPSSCLPLPTPSPSQTLGWDPWRLSRLLHPELRSLLKEMLRVEAGARVTPATLAGHPYLRRERNPPTPDPEPRPMPKPKYCIVC